MVSQICLSILAQILVDILPDYWLEKHGLSTISRGTMGNWTWHLFENVGMCSKEMLPYKELKMVEHWP